MRSRRRQSPNRLRTPSAQVPGKVLVHLEHGHLVLAEDALELVVGQDLAAVLRVLQVVGLDVVPQPYSPPRPGVAVLGRPPQPALRTVAAAAATRSPRRCWRWSSSPSPARSWLASFTSDSRRHSRTGSSGG